MRLLIKQSAQLVLLILSFFHFKNSCVAQQITNAGINYIHYRSSDTKAGDVIPFYHEGSYRIFYLRDNNWTHLMSKDLIRWKELPDALAKKRSTRS